MSLCGLKCDFKKIRAPSSESWEKPRDDVGCSARWRFCTKSYDCFTWFRGWINCQSVQCLLLAIIWITACGALHILSQTFINPIFIDKLKICSSGDFGYVKFGLSEKNTKFEKIFLMVLTNQLIYFTMRKNLLNWCHLVSISKNVIFYAFLVVRIY